MSLLKVEPGQEISGKYVIEDLLGQGGMGAVFVARQVQLNRRVAIKLLLPIAEKSPEAVARFEREAQAAAALQSEHVTRIYDFGRLDSGEPYIVMELLRGHDLAKVLERRGPLSPAEVASFLVQACDAVGEAHALGIVHRDLKPANLFLAERLDRAPIVKVLDFGISKVHLTKGASLTLSASFVGSPLYMAPEQIREAKTVDARTDIWALGVTAYQLVTGQAPFEAQAVGEICAKILMTTPPTARSIRPDIPERFDAVIMRCLEKEPAERFPTVSDLVKALAVSTEAGSTLRSGEPQPPKALSAPAVGGSTATFFGDSRRPAGTDTGHAVSTTNGQRHSAAPATRRMPMVAAAGLAAIVVAGVAIATLTHKQPPAQPLAHPSETAPTETTSAFAFQSPPPPTATTADDDGNRAAADSAHDAGQAQAGPPKHSGGLSPRSAPPGGPAPQSNGSTLGTTRNTKGTEAPKPKPNCSPPYIIDSAGHHVYKPECI